MHKAMRLALIGVGALALSVSSGCALLAGAAIGAGAGYVAAREMDNRGYGYYD
jgi:hypothetical protein